MASSVIRQSDPVTFCDTKEYRELKFLRQRTLQRRKIRASDQKVVDRWKNFYILKILVWKNLTLRCRRKIPFFLLLFQILFWFGIACFTLAMRNIRLVFPAELAFKPTQLVPRVHPEDFRLPIAVSFDLPSKIRVNPPTVKDTAYVLTSKQLIEEIIFGLSNYYRATYKGYVPEFRLFTNESSLIEHLSMDPRLVYGIHISFLESSEALSALNYHLVFREGDVPLNTSTFNAYHCREPLHPAAFPNQDRCTMSLYGKYGFLLAQTALDTCLIRLVTSGPALHMSGSRKASLGNLPVEEEEEELVNEQSGDEWSHDVSANNLAKAQRMVSQPFIDPLEPSKYRLELPGLSLVVERFPEGYAAWSYIAEYAPSAPFYFVIALTPLFSFVLMELVTEKELSIKSILLTYGVSKPILWISWFITFALENLVLTSLIAFLCFISGVFGSHTSLCVVVLIFYTYLLSLITFGCMLSVFFQNTTIASAASTLFHLSLYFLGRAIHQARLSSLFLRSIFMLFSTVTFSNIVIDLISLLPDHGVSLSDLFIHRNTLHDVGFCIIFLIVDVFLYLGLTILLDHYAESIHRHWSSFVETLRYKCWTLNCFQCSSRPYRNEGSFAYQKMKNQDEQHLLNTTNSKISVFMDSSSSSTKENLTDHVEPVSEEISSRGIAVQLINLTKKFRKKSEDLNAQSGSSFNTVVNDISLELYRGEVFALLGHNGAGKTTTINMMTGLLPMDAGDIIIYNHSVRTEPQKVKELISVCPQKNVFLEDLTCLEHLILFAALRGLDVTEGLKMIQQGPEKFYSCMEARRQLKETRKRIVALLHEMNGKTTQAQRNLIVESERYFHKFGLSLFLDDSHFENLSTPLNSHDDDHFEKPSWESVLHIIEQVGLTERMFFTPRTLSGGMKRRLWLAISLLGNPRVLFLDEPTSGVDPLARQEIWSIIENEKRNGRCIIVTTHHMEEADLLADRKAIMVSGSICCLGTSLFLKTRFGIGYRLEIVLKKDGKTSLAQVWNEITRFVQRYVPNAKLGYDHGLQTSSYGLSTNETNNLDKTVCLFSLPVTSSNQFPLLFRSIENEKSNLGIEEYGIALTALEDVFFRFGQEDYHQGENSCTENIMVNPVTPLCGGESLLTAKEKSHSVNKNAPDVTLDIPVSDSRAIGYQQETQKVTCASELPAVMNQADDEDDSESVVEKKILLSKQKGLEQQDKTTMPFSQSHNDLLSQQLKPNKQGTSYEYFSSVIFLRWIQIIHNKKIFFIDVLLPLFVILLSLFFRENGPGELSAIFKPNDPHIIPMSDFTSTLTSRIPFSIDSQLSAEMVSQAYDLLAAFPDEIKSLLFQVESEEESIKTNDSQPFTGSSSSTMNFDTPHNVNEKPLLRGVSKYVTVVSPRNPGIAATPLSGRTLRNFFFSLTQNKTTSETKKSYQAGLSFELRTPQVLRADPVNTESPGGLQLRLFYNTEVHHLIPILFSLISNAILQKNVNKFSEQQHFNPTLSVSDPPVEKWETPNAIPMTSGHKIKENIVKVSQQPHINTTSVALPGEYPEFVTPLTYGMYVMLTVGLSILPSRFGTQMMVEKARGTKHMMIIMGLPFKYYWLGSFVTCYLAMLFGNILATFFIAYFIPLFWSFACIPILICTLFHSASVLLFSFFLSQIFFTVKVYSMVLQLSSVVLCLVPAYFVSVFSDAASSDTRWYYLMFISHIVSSFLFPPYNPIGILIGTAVVISNFYHRGRLPTFTEYFDFNRLPIWNILGATFQAIFLFALTVYIDKRNYSARVTTPDDEYLLDSYYKQKQKAREHYLEQAYGDELLIPASLRYNKDEQVLGEEQRCNEICTRLMKEESSHLKASYRNDNLKKNFLPSGSISEDIHDSFLILPLVLMNDIHYVFPPTSNVEYPVIPVQGVSLSIKRGEVLGLLGPNGAGKTTCLKLLTCHYTTPAPTRGKAFLGGHDICSNVSFAFSHLGLCPQSDALFTDISIRDNLEVFARIKCVEKASRQKVIQQYIQDLDLESHQHKRVEECSGGNKRRASIAVAFIGDPAIVLLDEPSSGIDPAGRRRVAALIRKKSENNCVLLTTHSMDEAESLCTRIGIMVNGELNCIDRPLALRNRYGFGIRLEVLFDEKHPQYATVHSPNSEWKRFLETKVTPNYTQLQHIANHVTYSLPLRTNALGDLFGLFEDNKDPLGIKEFGISQPTFEQIFISFAKRQRSAYETSQIIFQC